MTPIIHKSPDMVLETIALLYLEPNYEMLNVLTASFFDFDNFKTDVHIPLHKRYIMEFRKHRTLTENWSFFSNMSIAEYLTVACAFLSESDLVYRAEDYNNEEFLAFLGTGYEYISDSSMLFAFGGTENTFTEYLDKAAGDEFKALAAAPKEYFSLFAKSIRENVSAAEAAWDSVRGEIRPFLDKYWQTEYFINHSMFSRDGKQREVFPMVAVYSSSFIIKDICYCGVYNIDTRSKDDILDEKAELLTCAKALNDPNRLDILMMLREKPCYNREIAETLGLSPATVMHHTDALIQSGLIVLSADNANQKRVYFKISSERVDWLCRTIKKVFGNLEI